MYTLQQIKDRYYAELAKGIVERQPLEQYVKRYAIPCYDCNLNLVGYEALNEYIRTRQ